MRRHDGEYRWMLHRAVPVRDAEGAVGQWFGTVTDIDDTRRLSESRDLLAKELSHRIKNIFAVISGLVALAAGKKPERKEFADELGKTIRALSRAHEFVRPSGGSGKSNLHGLLGELFAAYGSGEGARVRVRGDDCAIGSRAATPLALVFHELATNSAKYGALATEEGHVELAVEDRGGSLLLTWTEHGGSKPDGEPVPGFGTRLVETSVTGQLGGAWQRRFEPGGLVAELTVSKDAIAA
jgi:two-component sensor histidine kinase